jgi:hypothetical protein
MPDGAVLADYRKKLDDANVRADAAERANGISLRLLIVCLALSAWLLYEGIGKQVPAWSFLLPLAGVVAAGRWHGKNRDKWRRLVRLRKFRERALGRMEGRWRGNGLTGESFRVPHHVYDLDLAVLGDGSLFETLCTARTGIGGRQLARYLLNPCGIVEAMARQEAVRELMPQCDLRERIELLGQFSFQESTWGVFSDWIAIPSVTAPELGTRHHTGQFLHARPGCPRWICHGL